MEPITLCHQVQPENSIKEADDLPDLQDGRSYECIYCKHGFTTAQALGGHMNVHRKDRSKSRSNSSNNKSDPRLYQPCLITSCIHSPHHEGQTHEFMLRSSPAIYDENTRGKHQIFSGSISSPSQEEMRLGLSLSLQFGLSTEEEYVREDQDKEDELDLELRLGNYM